ncbi:RNase adaptor protein RapZ [Methylococcaceae bacterium HT1]|nr:RNase adaptor protein RapZ [Methylococcaceae bacterium HT1]TXL17161.1 RNase adaptor protein RapZ [Methylococcaceae bacterium HT3]TXL23602.1 RNase adaptor protein RapZ [Methylococcaceae bacterium HT2]
MKLLILTGLSGSGKSIALDTLEDCGFCCIDNLPIKLLDDFVSNVMLQDQSIYSKTAIGIDARNQSESLYAFGDKLAFIREQGIQCDVIFMQAEDSVLLKRYSETRRRHPLTNLHLSLKEAIKIEKDILKPIAKGADLIVDTSRTHYHQLRQLIRDYVQIGEVQKISIQTQSFGFKHGIPLDVDFVFDARCLPNPYWNPDLRGFTGKDQKVIDFLQSETIVTEFFQDISTFLERWIPRFEQENRSYLTVAIGCTGGQHRSVFLIDRLARYFQSKAFNVIVRHREIQ